MNKLEDLIATSKLNELLGKNQVVIEEKKEKNTVLWFFAIIGAVVAVAGIAYAVYRYFTPDYLDDFDEDDDFEDFDDDLFEDEE